MEKITEQELEKLQELVKNFNNHQLKLGDLEMEKHSLLHNVLSIQADLQSFQNELRETYGDIVVDIADGKITKNESSKED